MRPESFEKICDRVIEYSFYLLLFLVPLVMTPWNYELFEYNKMMLTYGFTVIIAGAWLIKMVLSKRFLIKRTPLDVPLLIFLASQVLSTVFSIDRHTSLFGYYSRFHGGLLSTISYFLLYYALVSNFDKAKILNAIRYTLCSAALVSLYGIAEHFGIDAKYWVQDVRNRVFSTLGQPNWLSAWLAAILPVSLALALGNTQQETRDTKKYVSRFAYCVLPALFLLCLFFTKSRSGIPAALLSLAFFFLLLAMPKILSFKKQLLLPAIFVFVIIVFGSGFWGLRTLFKNTSQDILYILDLSPEVNIPIHQPHLLGSESGDIRKIVWRGAVKIFKTYPIFGSGVETFAYSYYQFRPAEHNLVSEWDFLYNKAHNEYFNFLATTGALGLLAYFGIIGVFLGWGWVVSFGSRVSCEDREDKKHTPNHITRLTTHYSLLIPAFLSGFASIIITNFFGFSVVPVALFFFLYPGFAFVLSLEQQTTNNKQHREKSIKPEWWQKTLIIFCLLSSVFCLLKLAQFWYADVLFARSNKLERMNDFSGAFNNVQRAITLNPGEPLYHDALAFASANLAVTASEQNQTGLSNQLVNLAISSSSKALSISSRNMNFWKTRAKIFYKLSEIDPKYLQGALDTLVEASKLAPTDAKIFYNLSLVYYQMGQKEKAVETLQKTLEMKSNYNEAKTALELILKQ